MSWRIDTFRVCGCAHAGVSCVPVTVVVNGVSYADTACWWEDDGGGGDTGSGSGSGVGGGGGQNGAPGGGGLGGFDTNVDQKMDCWKDVTGAAPAATTVPESGKHTTAVSSPYGYSATRPGNWHYGTDYVSTKSENYGEGEYVHAISNAVVLAAGETAANGKYVKLGHYDGKASYYLHLKSISLTVGMQITAGRVVGTMNCTGNCYGGGVRNAQSGTHVHVEVRSDTAATRSDDHGTTEDPQAYNNRCP